MPDCDSAQYLPIKKWTKRADPRVRAKRGERFADQHHVGLGDAGVHCTLLINRGNTRFETTCRCQIRVNGDYACVTCKYLHRGSNDFSRGVLLLEVNLGKC